MDQKKAMGLAPVGPGPYGAGYGITMRQHYAGLAMQGFCANGHPQVVAWDFEKMAEYAVEQADALLAALTKAEGAAESTSAPACAVPADCELQAEATAALPFSGQPVEQHVDVDGYRYLLTEAALRKALADGEAIECDCPENIAWRGGLPPDSHGVHGYARRPNYDEVAVRWFLDGWGYRHRLPEQTEAQEA